MLWLLFYQDETTARYLSFSKLVERQPALDLNFDGNTVAWLQKYYRTRGTSAAELEGTGTLFHTQPFLRHYQELRDLARQLGRWETLRPEVLAFLGAAIGHGG
jgi:hypothetical protein